MATDNRYKHTTSSSGTQHNQSEKYPKSFKHMAGQSCQFGQKTGDNAQAMDVDCGDNNTALVSRTQHNEPGSHPMESNQTTDQRSQYRQNPSYNTNFDFGDCQSQHDEQYRQQQEELQLFRSMQASKQMAYEVYANVISSLEEYEKRETRRQGSAKPSSSNLDVTNLSHKTNQNIKDTVEGQLQIFQMNLRECSRDVVKDVKETLMNETLKWVAQRDELQIPLGETDKYAAQLYEILSAGKTKHPSSLKERPEMTDGELKDVLKSYMHGEHKRGELDKMFRDDRTRKAKVPTTRSGSSALAGVQRLRQVRPDLDEYFPCMDMR